MNQQSDYLNHPVFISGYNKSGTTLFLSLLDHHPQLVVIPEELDFYQNVLYEKDKATAIKEKTGFKMFLSNGENMPEWKQGKTWYPEGYPEFDHVKFNQLFEKALQDSQTFTDLMLSMVEAFVQVDQVDPANKCYWVSKTPKEDIFFPVMQKMFGRNFKFVYLVRDPRDVYNSIVRRRDVEGLKGNQDPKSVIRFSVYWQSRTRQVMHYQKKYDNVLILRYEDVLLHTEDTLRKLCNFLQIEYQDILLQPSRHGKSWGGNSIYSGGFKGLSTDPIGRYKKYLDPKYRVVLENLLSKELIALGYMDKGGPQRADGENIPIPWRDYWAIATKWQLRYMFNQRYFSFRYNFPQLH
jgi:hypothetical protein